MKKFLLILSFYSCASIQPNKSDQKDLEEKWIGKSDKNIVTKYGLPKKVIADSSNGKIYVYEYSQADYSRQRDTIINNNPNCKIFKAITRTAIFKINDANKITKVLCLDADSSKVEFLSMQYYFKQQ